MMETAEALRLTMASLWLLAEIQAEISSMLLLMLTTQKTIFKTQTQMLQKHMT